MKFTPLASSSSGNAYLVESPGVAPLLLECGLPIKKLREKLSFGITGLAGCLVSHSHGDHSKAVKDLLKAGVDVWTSKETAAALGVADHHRIHAIESEKEFVVNGFWIIPFDLHHDVPCQGFLIDAPDGERLLFVPDTEFVTNRFKRVTVLAIECNHEAGILSGNIVNGEVPAVLGRRIRRNHLSLSVVKDFILANNMQKTLREIHLIHLSNSNSDEARFRREIQEITGVPVYIAGE
jgi:phosphoribosyl 1,2-cyclic phosphodiesterase